MTIICLGLAQGGVLALPKPYHLDSSVTVWSDYLRLHLHPRNISLINQYKHNDNITPFDNFKLGEEVWKEASFNDEFTDRIRCYMEESNNLQVCIYFLGKLDGNHKKYSALQINFICYLIIWPLLSLKGL